MREPSKALLLAASTLAILAPTTLLVGHWWRDPLLGSTVFSRLVQVSLLGWAFLAPALLAAAWLLARRDQRRRRARAALALLGWWAVSMVIACQAGFLASMR